MHAFASPGGGGGERRPLAALSTPTFQHARLPRPRPEHNDTQYIEGPRKRHTSVSSFVPSMIPPLSVPRNVPESTTSSAVFGSPSMLPTHASYNQYLASSSHSNPHHSLPPHPAPSTQLMSSPVRPRRTSGNQVLSNRYRRPSRTPLSSVPVSTLHQTFPSVDFNSPPLILPSSFSQRHPSSATSSPHLTGNAFVAISRRDSPEAMIEVIASNYERLDVEWGNQARNRLHRLLKEATSNSDRSVNSTYGRVVEYLRGLQSLTTVDAMDVPMELVRFCLHSSHSVAEHILPISRSP